MQLIAKLIIAASMLLAVQASAAERAEGAAEACSEFSQAGLRDCVAKKLNDSTALLKQAEAAALATISKWDEDAKYIKLAKARLQASNSAFKQYSQAQCALAGALVGSAAGNAFEIRRMACLADLSSARVEQLSAGTAALPQK